MSRLYPSRMRMSPLRGGLRFGVLHATGSNQPVVHVALCVSVQVLRDAPGGIRPRHAAVHGADHRHRANLCSSPVMSKAFSLSASMAKRSRPSRVVDILYAPSSSPIRFKTSGWD